MNLIQIIKNWREPEYEQDEPKRVVNSPSQAEIELAKPPFEINLDQQDFQENEKQKLMFSSLQSYLNLMKDDLG